VNAADLDYRARTLTGCIPPHLVSRLVELGHTEEVEFQAGHGEWFCARERARLLAGQDRQAEALEVLAPYVATGWWKAAETKAELLAGWGRTEEAIMLARPYAEAGDRLALDFFARLLARHGQADEAFALLRPHIADWFLAAALVDIAEGAGRDEDAAALLAARIEAGHRCDTPSCRRRDIEPWNAVDLLAAIRERQGRIDDAIALLHTETPPRSTTVTSWPTCWPGTTASRNCGRTRPSSTTGTPRSVSRSYWRSAVTWRAPSPCTGSRGIRRSASFTGQCSSHNS
jgi:hypothetical protein